ncbi:MAG: peptide chain release factor N(5)-glutamine methyltransferase [Paludibacteraceae bacterium]|nr:peptide chain release factor N(5)-glutamine methyltransferase [Paludibacteraceae bacterium]
MGKIPLLTANGWRVQRQLIEQQLLTTYPCDEAKALSWWVVEELTQRSRTQLLTSQESCFLPAERTADIVERLLKHEPVQYIFSHTLWRGLDLEVSPAVLIPRPETAQLVDWVLQEQSSEQPLQVLDACTGSGCIAIALKTERPMWQVTGCDISQEALEIARKNGTKHNTDIQWLQTDILTDKTLSTHRWDCVVSNPPYIPSEEKVSMPRNVVEYEPHTALFVPNDDPLLFYRSLAQLHTHSLYVEAHEQQAQAVADLLKQNGYTNVTIRHDLYGRERMVGARR